MAQNFVIITADEQVLYNNDYIINYFIIILFRRYYSASFTIYFMYFSASKWKFVQIHDAS